MVRYLILVVLVLSPCARALDFPAFDHLGDIPDQSSAAAACGYDILYTTGVGSLGYTGLPPAEQLKAAQSQSRAYIQQARSQNIRQLMGYVCATSIVKLATFDKNWEPEFRAFFYHHPSDWLQQDKTGKPLPSWYGGDYSPACMNNPDWRNYEERIVQLQLDAGCDGIFFDNPTVHPEGCYCEHCMQRFAQFIKSDEQDISALRRLASSRKEDFLRFRATIAADFITDMRARARKTHPNALITANNSLNSPEAFFSQIRTYGYSIGDMSREGGEDLIVVEDMATQPRTLADGKTTLEYGPVYEMLHAIAHDKPIIACVLADGDYHTPPNLMRLAMAEAAAHDASYMAWPTWPTDQRDRMSKAVKPQTDLLREHADLLDGSQHVADVTLYLDMDRWIQSDDCRALAAARALAGENIQFQVTTKKPTTPGSVVITPTNDPLHLDELKKQLPTPAITLMNAPPTVRAIVRQKKDATIVHLLNLNIQKLSSYEDRVTPATDIRIRLRTGGRPRRDVIAYSADENATMGHIPCTAQGAAGVIEFPIGRLEISTILVIR